MLPDGHHKLLSKLSEVATRIPSDSSIKMVAGDTDMTCFDAILCVGKTARPDFPWTVINSNGWVSRVSSGIVALDANCTQFNPIAALTAASLGVAEVFKRLVCLKPSRGKLLDGTTFNLLNYQTQDADPGPSLPKSLPVNLLLAGAGAIGNGVVYLLSRLPVEGRCLIVDKQSIGPENIGTGILVGPADVGKDKAVFAASVLKHMTTQGFKEDLSSFARRLGTVLPYPEVALGCLDSIEARHDLQTLWLDNIIDGAISDFACQVSCHPWGENIACLICLFRHPAGELAELVASRATGLSLSRSGQPQEAVTEDDVSAALPEKQSWLRDRVGRQICSVIQEAGIQDISEQTQRRGFQPSVPFVACLSASMVVAELVKYVAAWPSTLEPRFQMDVLRGPGYGQFIPQERRKDCICITRQRNINLIRQRHGSLGGTAIDGGK
jgi:molybdopterin/thiamine biosynthesis adenylyltransferase